MVPPPPPPPRALFVVVGRTPATRIESLGRIVKGVAIKVVVTSPLASAKLRVA